MKTKDKQKKCSGLRKTKETWQLDARGDCTVETGPEFDAYVFIRLLTSAHHEGH